MTSRERLLEVLSGRIPDRVPISLYEFDGGYDDWIHDDPTYQGILDYAEGRTDKLYNWSPAWPNGLSGQFLTRIHDDQFEEEIWREGESTYRRLMLQTPKGPLTTLNRRDPHVHTTWTMERFVKTAADLEAVLSIPYDPVTPSMSDFPRFVDWLGDRGIPNVGVADTVCVVKEMFQFEPFQIACIEQPELIRRAMDTFQERILDYLEVVLDDLTDKSLFRIIGPEYATPPFFHPEYFTRFVTNYDRELVERIQSRGGFARIHCHGNIRAALDDIASMAPDALEPLEPPPDGDIELWEIKARIGDRITLMGNIEERVLEVETAEGVREIVRRSLEDGMAGGRFVLMATAMPIHTPLEPRIRDNILAFIDAGLEFGEY